MRNSSTADVEGSFSFLGCIVELQLVLWKPFYFSEVDIWALYENLKWTNQKKLVTSKLNDQ